MRFLLTASLAAFVVSPALGQDAESPLPVQAIAITSTPRSIIPAGTEIPLRMSETVTTKGSGWEEGDQFGLSVAADVKLGNYIVIPRGTPAKGRITWLTSRGAFGKSGKMDVELEYIEISGRRINVDGTYRQEGDGATLATVGGVIVAGVFAGFITGKSGEIPQGRELISTLEFDLPVALPEGASADPEPVRAQPLQGSANVPAPATGRLMPGPDGTVRVGSGTTQ